MAKARTKTKTKKGIIDFPRMIGRAGLKIDSTKIAEHSFFVLQGVFTGIALNDIWRVLNLPGNNIPMNVAGVPSQFDVDYLYQLIIATIAGAAEVLGAFDHGIAFGTGIALGSTWANSSEKGQYIGGTAAAAPPKIDQSAPTPQPLPKITTPVIVQQPTFAPSVSGAPLTPTIPAQSTYNPYANAVINSPHLGYNLP